MEVVKMEDKRLAQRLQRLEALGQQLSAKRKQAINHRAQSGIEEMWTEDEEFYMGVDDLNREEFGGIMEKPSSTRMFTRGNPQEQVRSTVFPNITQSYVDAGAARIADILLPTDDRNFVLQPTPIPSLLDDIFPEAQQQAPIQQEAMPAQDGMQEGAMPEAQQPAAQVVMVMLPDGTSVPLAEAEAKIKEQRRTASRKAERAQQRIDDWLRECKYIHEVRKGIDDCAKVGTGVIKGPFATKVSRKTWVNTEGNIAMVLQEEIKPASKHISYWNLYPDPSCGECIHDGNWIFEVQSMSEKKLKSLKGLPGYIDWQINEAIDEGPTKYTPAGAIPWDDKETKGQYQVWHFTGEVSKADLEACGCSCEDSNTFSAIVTMVNDRVIKAAINPLEDGTFPYDVIRWKRRMNYWAGIGLARQMRTAQRMVVAATRNMMDNAGLGAGPMLVVGRGIKPQNNIWEIKPRKIWVRDQESDDRPIEQDFKSIVIPMLQGELERIIQLGMKMAEDTTGLPQLLQGQQGSAPDTVGGMVMLNNNANSVLRRLARNFDNDITIPHIQRYYDWLMLYGDDPEEKGDLQVIARGSSALVERDSQNMEMQKVLELTQNPVFEKSPKKAFDEYLKSRRFDPLAFEYTEEELAAIKSQPPTPPPQVTVAEIKTAAEKEIAAQKFQTQIEMTNIRAGSDELRVKTDSDRDTIYAQSESERTRVLYESKIRELELKRELAMLEYANTNQMKLEEIKAKLASDAMKLRVQKELSGMKGGQVLTPPVEPGGRAPDGQSFER